jgi:hypothetical protein
LRRGPWRAAQAFEVRGVSHRFDYALLPAEVVDVFRSYYGPTMNAFDAAAGDGRADLESELLALFEAQNESGKPGTTSIPATFLRVTVAV